MELLFTWYLLRESPSPRTAPVGWLEKDVAVLPNAKLPMQVCNSGGVFVSARLHSRRSRRFLHEMQHATRITCYRLLS